MTITERRLALLRLMHAGVPLRVLPKGTAMFDLSSIPQGIRRATVEQMQADGLIEYDGTTDRYTITEAGRDHVRVRDRVSDFLESV